MKALLNTVERLRLTTKLVIGFSAGILVALVIGLTSLSSLGEIEADMERMYETDLLGISHVKEANINLIYMGRAMRQMMIAQDDVTRDRARTQVMAARETLRAEMAEARKGFFRPETLAQDEKFTTNFSRFNENVEHALALIEREKANPSTAARFITSTDFMSVVNMADDDLTALSKIKERQSKATVEEARRKSDGAKRTAVLFLVLGAMLSAALGVLIGVSITGPNHRLSRSVEELAAGKVEASIPHADYPNEIGILARSIRVLQDIYRKADEQHWVKSHVAEIGAALQRADDFVTLTQDAVSRIAPVIGAGHGAFYVADGQGAYSLLASYGYRERKHLSNCFAEGEGLVGQCVVERATIVLTAPKDYIRIGSGLGEGPPACIMVLPVIHGERVLGVLEVASFQPFTAREQAVLEALMPILSASLEILDRNLRTRELLAASQEQAERMEKQAAQLEEQQVEMEAQQAELLETENWFRSIIEAAPDGMMVTDESGRILLVNPAAEALFGYDAGELVGGDIDAVVSPDRRMGLRKDGARFPLVASSSPLPPRGTRGRCVSLTVRAA
ncbi:MCP four helix bundle domain-containing protein [Paramagnetospirillum magneticum]|uniref:histidine kinase n=1 Tax=Paramagnetospirillum magneticum (strain ATCC 700264 / AMB-1) TaxID=342108 RepID=Q2W340_PARM1|nr:MCP four helix bundle domain-containing protein [Paramagnetospirillum magneticum]BAE51735.1 Methyl-accepting chemotaxis protein [Paramagnetospirillum magneticum AMB-1]